MKNIDISYGLTAIVMLILGMYFINVHEVTIPQPETGTEKQVYRAHLLNADHQITGTYYYKEVEWSEGSYIRFTDLKGREITYSGNYLVTPIPDTVSVNNDQ